MSEPTIYEETAPKPNPKKPEEVSHSATLIAQTEDKSIFEWLQELGTSGALKIKLERKYPREWQGHHIAGYLEEYDEPFDEKDIKLRFGGGKYQVKTFRPNPKGGWVYAGAKSFEIEGDPRLSGALLADALPAGKPMPVTDDTALQAKAMDHMARQAEISQKRAFELEDERRKDGGSNSELLRMAMNPPAIQMMQVEMANMREALARKEEQLLKLLADAGKAPTTPSVIEKTFESLVAGESHRIEALRAQHDSELRAIRENHRHDLENERSRLQADTERRERSHEREIAMIRETHAQAIRSVEQSYEARIEGYKRHETELERQVTEAKTEVARLHAIKDKGPLDSIEDIVKIKNAMEVFGGGEQEPASTLERIVNGVLQSPIVQAVATRVENAPPAPPPQPQMTPEARKRAAVARRAQQQAQAQIPQQPVVQQIELNPLEVAAAIQFVEQAVANGTSPKDFANSVRSMVPAPILSALRQMGPDAFIEAAKPPDGSILYSQRGRNFLRKVLQHLMGREETPDPTPEPVAPEAAPAS